MVSRQDKFGYYVVYLICVPQLALMISALIFGNLNRPILYDLIFVATFFAISLGAMTYTLRKERAFFGHIIALMCISTAVYWFVFPHHWDTRKFVFFFQAKKLQLIAQNSYNYGLFFLQKDAMTIFVDIGIILLGFAGVGQMFRRTGRFFIESLSGEKSESGNAGLPSETWATSSEIHNKYNHRGGIILGEATNPMTESAGFDKNKKNTWGKQGKGQLISISPKEGNGHMLAVSESDSFKTSGLVIPNIINFDGPVIVLDPKGELFEQTAAHRRSLGYDAVVINAETGFDPWRFITPYVAQHQDLYFKIAKAALSSEYYTHNTQEFFKDQSVSLLAALIPLMLFRGEKNINAAILDILANQAIFKKEIFSILKEQDLAHVMTPLMAAAETEERRFNDISAEIRNKLSFAKFPNISSILQYAEGTDAKNAIGPKTDIYISITSSSLTTYYPMVRMIFTALYLAIQITEKPGAHSVRRLFLMDEAKALGRMDAIELILNEGRAIGVHLALIYQSFGQLSKYWGHDGAQLLIDSCQGRVFGPPRSQKYAREIEDMLGKHTIALQTESRDVTKDAFSFMPKSNRRSRSDSLQQVALLTSAQIMKLPSHACIIFAGPGKAILGSKAIYFTRKDMRDLASPPHAPSGGRWEPDSNGLPAYVED